MMRIFQPGHSRRLAQVLVDPSVICSVLSWCNDVGDCDDDQLEQLVLDVPRIEGLPDNATIVGLDYDWSRRGALIATIEHASLPLVAVGDPLPLREPTLQYVTIYPRRRTPLLPQQQQRRQPAESEHDDPERTDRGEDHE